MKYLIVVICLVLVGCGSLSPSSRHKRNAAAGLKASIQRVLEARANIRAIISHPPRTVDELSGIANMNPNSTIFLAQDFTQRLQMISLEGCPRDFKDAFAKYVAAWNERAASSPNLLILIQAGTSTPSASGAVQNEYAAHTESAWNALKAICTKYGVTAE
jgi:hypothetical protein